MIDFEAAIAKMKADAEAWKQRAPRDEGWSKSIGAKAKPEEKTGPERAKTQKAILKVLGDEPMIAREIADKAGTNPRCTRVALRRMIDKGQVEQRGTRFIQCNGCQAKLYVRVKAG